MANFMVSTMATENGNGLGSDATLSAVPPGYSIDAGASDASDDDAGDGDVDDDGVSSSTLAHRGAAEVKGTLSKWTNYIHGWQARHVVLKDGVLSYYKSEADMADGCRGAIHLGRAVVTLHQLDECRFDVTLGDSVWYMRADSEVERGRWVYSLEQHRLATSDSASASSGGSSTSTGYGTNGNGSTSSDGGGLRRHPSLLSLHSAASLSTASSASFGKQGRVLRETVHEASTYRELLCRQIDILQSYFDSCASSMALFQRSALDAADFDINNSSSSNSTMAAPNSDPAATPTAATSTLSFGLEQQQQMLLQARDLRDVFAVFAQHGAHTIDFKSETVAFRATTAAILGSIASCVELVKQREEHWRRRLDKEIERRKKVQARLEEAKKAAASAAATVRAATSTQAPPTLPATNASSSTSATGVSSSLSSSTAVATATATGPGPDFEEGPHCRLNEEEFYDAVDMELEKIEQQVAASAASARVAEALAAESLKVRLRPEHPLWATIELKVRECLMNAKFALPEGAEWELIADDGPLKVYRREYEVDGVVLDPLKAVHSVQGLTGRELCELFFDPSTRLEWEATLEQCRVVETMAEDTVMLYQVLKRVWPTAQRDCLYWSHLRHVVTEDGADYWIVINQSTTDDAKYSISGSKYVRCHFKVALVCETVVTPPPSGQAITRDCISTRISYIAEVNPGGYVPPTVLRMVYKREYPRFLRHFTEYVRKKTAGKPPHF